MDSKIKPDLFDKARNYAFRLLKFRVRSEYELYQRLKRKKFDQDTINRVIQFLKEKAFIDDKEFCRIWVQDKIKRPLGLRRIRQELKIKGIDKDIIEEVLEKVKSNYNEDNIVLQLARIRWKRLRKLNPQKARTRLYAYLLRRGFSPDVIYDTVNQL